MSNIDYKWECEKQFDYYFPEHEDKEGAEYSYFDWCFKMALLEELKHLNEILSTMRRQLYR
jgi:hypothetical protein